MSKTMKIVLIVEDEASIRDTLVELFQGSATTVFSAADLPSALHLLGRHPVDLLITDIRLHGRYDAGLQVMGAAGLLAPEATVIALTAFPDEGNRGASQRLGASYFLQKPVDLTTISAIAVRHGVPTAVAL